MTEPPNGGNVQPGDSERGARSTDDTDRWIRCVCGETEIRHSHGNKWECGACGRFHDGDALDRLADKTRAMDTDTDRSEGGSHVN